MASRGANSLVKGEETKAAVSRIDTNGGEQESVCVCVWIEGNAAWKEIEKNKKNNKIHVCENAHIRQDEGRSLLWSETTVTFGNRQMAAGGEHGETEGGREGKITKVVFMLQNSSAMTG